MAKLPDQYNSNAKVANDDGTAHQFFVQQWNLLLAFIKSTLATFATISAQLAELFATGITGSNGITVTGSFADGGFDVSLTDTTVTPGTYGDATHTPQITIDQQGRIETVANVLISGGGGSTMSPFWATAPTVPTLASFTPVNGGVGVAQTQTTRGVAVTTTGIAGDRNQLLERTTPGATWTMTALVVGDYTDRQFMTRGLYVRDSATGKMQVYGFAATNVPTANGGVPALTVVNWSAINTFFGNQAGTPVVLNNPQAAHPTWFKLVLDATNLTLSVSTDGEFWEQKIVIAKGSYVGTIDRAGLIFGANQTDAPTGVDSTLHLMSFSLV